MKANEGIAIVDTQIVLVPYRPEHVAVRAKGPGVDLHPDVQFHKRYHEWMTSEELRELTASDALTLEEEYEMQRKWQLDEDKLTFIILARDEDELDSKEGLTDELVKRLPMIGDVNLFLKGTSDDVDFEVEAEIMIAEPLYRRRGLASRALQLVLSYSTSTDSLPPLPVSRSNFVARIGENNKPSIELFKKLGFLITKRVEVFEEIEMRYYDDGSRDHWLVGEKRVFL